MIATAAAMPAAPPTAPPTAHGTGLATAADFAGLLNEQCALATSKGAPASAEVTSHPDAVTTPAPAPAPSAGPQGVSPSAFVVAAATPPTTAEPADAEMPAPMGQAPRPHAATSCRAPTPISLRGGESGELASAEVPPPPVAPESAVLEAKPLPAPEAPPSPDPATSLLAQLGLQLAPVPVPPAGTSSELPVKPVSGAAVDALVLAAGDVTAAAPSSPPAGDGRLIELAKPALGVEAGPPITAGEALPPPPVESGRGADPGLAPPSFFAIATGTRAETPALTPVPVNTARADWPEQLSSQIVWQLGQEVQEARIALAPDDLGAIDLQVRVQDGRVNVHMGAAQPATRELLSEALPRLRELLGESGLSLSQASVFSQDAQSRGHPAWSRPRGPDRADQVQEAPSPITVTRSRGLLDHYA